VTRSRVARIDDVDDADDDIMQTALSWEIPAGFTWRPTFPDGAHYRSDGPQWPSAAFAASCGLRELAKGCLHPAGIGRAFGRKTTFFVAA